MPPRLKIKNIHTYCAKLEALWTQMRHTVEYLIRSEGLDWVLDNCGGVIEVGYSGGFHFFGTADDVAMAVDELVLKAQRKAHNDPNYTF